MLSRRKSIEFSTLQPSVSTAQEYDLVGQIREDFWYLNTTFLVLVEFGGWNSSATHMFGVRYTGPWGSVFKTGDECEQVRIVDTCLAHAHRAIGSLCAVLRDRSCLKDGWKWSINTWQGGMKILTKRAGRVDAVRPSIQFGFITINLATMFSGFGRYLITPST